VDRLKTMSRGLVRRYGIPLTFSRMSGSVYDPAVGALTGGSTTTYQVRVLLQHYSPALIAFSNGLIEVHDRKATGADASYTPQPGDTVEIEGLVYRVVEARDNTLAGTWEAHLRPM